MIHIVHESLEQELQVSADIIALTCKVPFIELDDQYVVFRELSEQVRVLEDHALVERLQELIEQVLLHVSGHVLPLESSLLYVLPDLQIVVTGYPPVQHEEPIPEVNQRMEMAMSRVVSLDELKHDFSPIPYRLYE
jgi:hypothetical protein